MGRTENAFIVTMLLACCFQRDVIGAPHCPPSSGNSLPPSDCKHGIILNRCNNRVCAKGPGQPCNNSWWGQDECVAGTYCASCGRCLGCSANLNCVFTCPGRHNNLSFR